MLCVFFSYNVHVTETGGCIGADVIPLIMATGVVGHLNPSRQYGGVVGASTVARCKLAKDGADVMA